MIGNRTLAIPGPTNMPPRIARAMSVPLEDLSHIHISEPTRPY